MGEVVWDASMNAWPVTSYECRATSQGWRPDPNLSLLYQAGATNFRVASMVAFDHPEGSVVAAAAAAEKSAIASTAVACS